MDRRKALRVELGDRRFLLDCLSSPLELLQAGEVVEGLSRALGRLKELSHFRVLKLRQLRQLDLGLEDRETLRVRYRRLLLVVLYESG